MQLQFDALKILSLTEQQASMKTSLYAQQLVLIQKNHRHHMMIITINDHHMMMTMTICWQLVWVAAAAGCVDTGSILHPPHQLPPNFQNFPTHNFCTQKSPNFAGNLIGFHMHQNHDLLHN